MVVTYAPDDADGVTQHEIAARVEVARTIAALKGFRFGGGYEPALRRGGELYFVPSQTLSTGQARELGIRGEDDLFGGVVPHRFVANKSIAHPLPSAQACRPQGWSDAFARRVREVVLPGFSAFSRDDAKAAARLLLADGPVRIKRARGIGGRGQAVVESDRDPAFDALDNSGQLVYGGSDLLVVRRGYDELARLDLPAQARAAVQNARKFDSAVATFDGLFASRRNYDVLHGRDARGRWYCAVLEQSWRIGGASGPEVAALAAFRVDPRLRAVHARSTEAYDTSAPVPRGAIVHFRGVDSRAGPITKYTVVEPYDRTL